MWHQNDSVLLDCTPLCEVTSKIGQRMILITVHDNGEELTRLWRSGFLMRGARRQSWSCYWSGILEYRDLLSGCVSLFSAAHDIIRASYSKKERIGGYDHRGIIATNGWNTKYSLGTSLIIPTMLWVERISCNWWRTRSAKIGLAESGIPKDQNYIYSRLRVAQNHFEDIRLVW